jgi:FkbM family methyltransferase
MDVYVDMFQESSNLKFMGKSREETLKIISNMMNTEPEEKKIDIFDFRFESEENKIFITYKDEKSLGRVFFSIKDRDSNTCIFGFDSWIDHFGAEIWCIPIPKPYFDFAENRNFSGFKIEAYQNKSDLIPFFSGEIELKKAICKKKIASFPSLNYEPIFVNYSQFFVDWIYNGFFAGSRVKRAIDIGANIGLFTEWVLDRFGSDTEVISVEPNSQAVEAFEFLHKGKNNVHLKKLAVSEKSGDELELGVNPGNSLISSLDHLEGLSQTEKVSTISLNDLLADFGWEQCDLLKIDVEGAEYDIFKSVTSDDLKKFKFILMEFHYNNGRLRSLLNKMKEAGFSIDIRDDDTRFITTAENDRGTVFATRLD